MLVSDNQPRLAQIRACIEDLIQTTDHSVLTVKGIRAHVQQDIDAEAGRDYDKAWLKAQVDELLAAQRAPCAGGSSGEQPGGDPDGDPVGVNPDSQVTTFGLGTVVWAKLQGYPYWPGMVIQPNPRQRAAPGSSQPGMVFVKFFGTHDFAYCETLLRWDDPDAKALKSKMPSKKLQKTYVLAVAEAEEEIAHPTPIAPDQGEEDAVQEAEEVAAAAEEETGERGAAVAQPVLGERGAATDSSEDEAPAARKPAAPKAKPAAKPAAKLAPSKKKRAITADSSDDEGAAPPPATDEDGTKEVAATASGEDSRSEDSSDDGGGDGGDGDGDGDDADHGDGDDSDDGESEEEGDGPAEKKKARKRAGGEVAGKQGGGKKASAKAARAASGEPKGPVNVYMLFAGAHRAAVKEENPSLTLGELGKELGARYKNLSGEELAHWQQQAVADKARYERELAEFKSKGGVTLSEQKRQEKGLKPKARQKPRDPSKPKAERAPPNPAKAKLQAKEGERSDLLKRIAKCGKMLSKLETKMKEVEGSGEHKAEAKVEVQTDAEAEVQMEAEEKAEDKPEEKAEDKAEEKAEEKADGPVAETAGEEMEVEMEMRPPKAATDKGEVEAGAAAANMEEAVAKKVEEVGVKVATAEASGPSVVDIAKYKELQLKEKAGLEAKLQAVDAELQQLEAQAAAHETEQVQKRKEREQQRAQDKKRQQRKEAAAEVAKKPTPPTKLTPKSTKAAPEPERQAEAKPGQSALKRPADGAKPEQEPKRIKEDAKEPLSADEMAELVARLTRAMEAAPPDEVVVAAVLAELEGSRMTLALLRETGVGKLVNTLKKTVRPALAGRARALVDQWKLLQAKTE